jgi:hypothetical protein
MNLNKYNLDAYTTAGVRIGAADVTHASKGVTLGAATYYIPLPAEVVNEKQFQVALKWAAAVAGIITVEVCPFTTADVTDYGTTAGDWTQLNPSDAYVAVSGTGNSATAATVTAGGTNAGSAVFDFLAAPAMRMRLKLVLNPGGLVRAAASAKRA